MLGLQGMREPIAGSSHPCLISVKFYLSQMNELEFNPTPSDG